MAGLLTKQYKNRLFRKQVIGKRKALHETRIDWLPKKIIFKWRYIISKVRNLEVYEMNYKHKPYGPYERFFKRPLDVLFGFTVVIGFLWLYLLVAVLVRIKLGSPILFMQERPGREGKVFKLYKFRSMSNAKDKNGNLLPDKDRLTEFGKMLRSTSLDELPEIFNIIKGDMSVIGPRPLAVQYLPYYSEEEMHRHDVRPGLSGLAQVNGRNSICWEEKFKFDIKYVNKVTFLMDVKIFLSTIKTVLKQQDIGVRGVDSLIDFDVYRQKQLEHGGPEK